MSQHFRFDRRSAGVLMHPTSLPGRHGCGDLGEQSHRFADFLAAAGQHWWQMLPVNPPGPPPGNSPYSALSAMAGSPWLISLEMLVERGLLVRADLQCRTQPGKGGQIIDPQPYRLLVLGHQLSGQTPGDADVAIVVDHSTEDIPLTVWHPLAP